MAEYTLTTNEVRDVFARVSEQLWTTLPYQRCIEIQASLREDFDRWLAEHDREAYQRGVEDCKRSYHAGTEPFFNA